MEIRGYTLTATGGTGQTTAVTTAFAQPLAVTLTETGGSPLPGASVTFTAPGSGAGATFGGSPATTNRMGIASATATANGSVGTYTVTASVAGGATATFNLTNAPLVASVGPSSGDVNGGSLVTITGGGFVLGTTVQFGGTPATVEGVTATVITLRTPAHAAGAVDVVVTVNGVVTTKAGAYTYGAVAAAPMSTRPAAPTPPAPPAVGVPPRAVPVMGGSGPPTPTPLPAPIRR